jgi:hypothetical protein
MTRKQLEEKREGLVAQMHWAALFGGDQELMDVLRDESGRLSRMLGRPNAPPATSIRRTLPPANLRAVRMGE